ncbi:MAG TPA: hypothetical protein VFM59_05020 [Salinimicrobium sp.]|nr:hypothetical protein [Salinimicrobium sp.]
MDFFDRHKALIITLLLFSLMILGLYNIRLSNSNKELTATLIDLQNYKIEEAEKEQKQEIQQKNVQAPKPNSVKTHQAYNENQEEAQENFESRLDEIFQKNSAESEASDNESSNTSSGEFQINKNKPKETAKQSDGNNSSEEISAKTGTLRNSSISFSLVGRKAIDIPNPIYTCDTFGTVVVNITVNAEGAVVNTSINEAASTTTNECLTAKAREYAAGAIFSKMARRSSQIGTITYNFQG